jgi:hypothetical protein
MVTAVWFLSAIDKTHAEIETLVFAASQSAGNSGFAVPCEKLNIRN